MTSGDRAPAGAEGARCRAGDRCDPLLRCDSDTRRCMVDDSIGDPYGPCYPNQTCDRGLICDVAINTCAPRPDLGQEGGLCYGNGTCDDDLSCIAGRCRVPPAR